MLVELTVNDASDGRRLEKVQSRAQNRVEQLLVVEASGAQVHEHEEYVGDVEEDALNETEYEIDGETIVLELVGLVRVLRVDRVVAPRAQPEARR